MAKGAMNTQPVRPRRASILALPDGGPVTALRCAPAVLEPRRPVAWLGGDAGGDAIAIDVSAMISPDSCAPEAARTFGGAAGAQLRLMLRRPGRMEQGYLTVKPWLFAYLTMMFCRSVAACEPVVLPPLIFTS